MIFDTYGLRYQPNLSQTGTSWGGIKFLHDKDSNRYGLMVSEWRKSYDSDLAVNTALNAVLETFYFLSGDKEVSYALWSWFDAKNIDGYANTVNFGFEDVSETSTGGVIRMNGIDIELVLGKGVTTVYFE